MAGYVAGFQPRSQLVDQPWDRGRLRRSVGFPAGASGHEHGPLPQPSRPCLGLRMTDQEMELEDRLQRPPKERILGQGADAVHRLPVGGDDPLCLF